MREEYDEEFWEKHSVNRPRDPVAVTKQFELLINKNPPELEVQKFLERNPWLLSVQHPHCHYILPEFSLNGQYRCDFIAPERCSGHTNWYLIEIERPHAQLMTKKGEFAETVRHAVQQIKDWRMWLWENQETAKKLRISGGLGLHDMSRLITGQVIVGRRTQVTERYNQLRADLLEHDAIELVTYDRIIEWALKRAEYFELYDLRSNPSA